MCSESRQCPESKQFFKIEPGISLCVPRYNLGTRIVNEQGVCSPSLRWTTSKPKVAQDSTKISEITDYMSLSSCIGVIVRYPIAGLLYFYYCHRL